MQGRGMTASDISRIVLLGPHETKKIGVVLDAQPRAMMINTLFSINLPGEITMPISEIVKTRSTTKEFVGEEIIPSPPSANNSAEIIVDNEDPGFIQTMQNTTSPLKKLLGIENQQGKTYMQINARWIPEYWQPVVQTNYYGKYIRSSVYTRGGTGEKTVTWATPIKESGYYDIYCYVGKNIDRIAIAGRAGGQARQGGAGGQGRQGGAGGQAGGAGPGGGAPGGNMGGPQADERFKDMHYKVYHDDGVEEITLDYPTAEGGWNMLGRYYLSPDSAKVVLTNLSEGKIVIGDAIRWVKQN
jgi:hypothetical protein